MSENSKRKLLTVICLILGAGAYPLAFVAWYASVIAAIISVVAGLYYVVLYGWDRPIIVGVVFAVLLLFTVVLFIIVLRSYVGIAQTGR